MYLQAHVLPTNKSSLSSGSLSLQYHTCLIKLLVLRIALYKRATVCVLVHQQFERQEHRNGCRVQCDFSIGEGDFGLFVSSLTYTAKR